METRPRGWWRLALVLLVLRAGSALAQTQIPADYVATVRPDPDGMPTRVSLAVYLLDLVAVDDLRQEFTADLIISGRWRDPRLADAADSEASRTLPLSEVWNPEIALVNRRGVSTLLPQVVRVDPRGEVLYRQRLYGQFSTRLDLRRFPSDEQTFQIRLSSYRYGPEEVAVEINSERSGRLKGLSVSGWNIGEPVIEVEPLVAPSSGSIARAGATYRLHAERETSYYRLTMVLPLILIALMAWSVFWIDPSFLPSQIGVSTASVFSLIAFRFSLQVSLPKISYLTTADWFVLGVTVLVFLALGEAVLTGSLAKTDREGLARRIDRWARWLYAAALGFLCFTMMR